ncbi:DUF1127 domain-containing protein [Ancylobacter pratisalsi]|uniref:DUF1127 domain-containing protein n=1 Tax=Ancylobacter pratisalsi TaxID=1745854 RepID=A0A6P1YMH6_9HYPH|nr:DUF1127 domain-containing protein [Ancylobacter pratisalsi]QIB34335.1 DUF1127 domain-containing protein [Ancylobacter pratisalsi]
MADVLVRHRTLSTPRHTISQADALQSLVKRIHLCIQRSQQRSVLAELDDERLRDLGLSREDVARECAKRFWQ